MQPCPRVAYASGVGWLGQPVAAPIFADMDRSRLAAHRLSNSIQSFLLVGALALLLGLLAWILGGPTLLFFVLAGVIVLYLANPIASPRLVLSLYRGRWVDPREAPELYEVLAELSARAGLRWVPRIFYIPSRVMNAFATGGADDAVVAVSDGLLRGLGPRELTAVLAHEVSHIANGDIQVMAFADMVSRIASLLGLVGQVLLLLSLPLLLLGGVPIPWLGILILLSAPTLSALVQLALSRNREYDADLGAAELTGDPVGLASALDRLERYQGRLWERILMPDWRVPDPSLLRSHPETGERIARLLALEAHADGYGSHARFLPATLSRGLGLPGQGPGLGPRRHLLGPWY
jgi:heat shock protein HtpX